MHDLNQHVCSPTHKKGHTLDLLVTRKTNELVTDVSVHRGLPSDHSAVKCLVRIVRPPASRQRVRSRKVREVDIGMIRKDISSALLPNSDTSNDILKVDILTDQFNSKLRKIIDSHAPVTERTVILRPHAPWYCDALRNAKQEKRRRERKYKATGLTVHRELYKEQCETYHDLLNSAKTMYHRDQISDAEPRDLFRVVDTLTKPKSSITLPAHDDPKDLADRFADYFHHKISSLRDRLDTSSNSVISFESNGTCSSSFDSFHSVSEEEVLKIIKSSHITSCKLDPLPVSITKECIDEMLPGMTAIVNQSLLSGSFPSSLKHAIVTPLLKKPKLDADELANYRPISNLTYLGKLIERVAISQLQSYLHDNDLNASKQSAYRAHHSTESALLRVQSDILCALDKGNEAILVLLDF
ncbi:uncharacterized protein [Amphiura filiformis]|uniref:uncharacterized protein n=1 Tax=Amphiura filiformis TaxID=82378 RepID=UPI003B2128EC